MRGLRFVCILALMLFLAGLSAAQPPAAAEGGSDEYANPADLAPLRELLALPEQDIDLARAKLMIDRLIDPATDEAAVLAQLDAMAAAVRGMHPANPSNRDRLDALLAYLYQPGPWNDHRPFAYDFDHPLGRPIEHKLLSVYLRRRKGNCVPCPSCWSSSARSSACR